MKTEIWKKAKGEILLPFKDAAVEHFYEDKNDACLQMLIFMFFIYIRNVLYHFHLSAPDLD